MFHFASRKFYGKQIKNRLPFYTLFQINPKTFSPFKLLWKSIAGKISGKPEFDCAVVGSTDDKYLGNKVLVPNESLVFIPFDNFDEAMYCVAILNSFVMKLVVASYAIETRIPPSVTQNVFIPKFDSRNQVHITLSELSKRAHERAKIYYEQNDLEVYKELKKIEEEIDSCVAKLYEISDIEFEEIKISLHILIEGRK